jgi:hypothetical protein
VRVTLAADESGLSAEQLTLLIDGGSGSGDVSFVWALTHLAIRENPDPRYPEPPTPDEIDTAFAQFDRLVAAGLVKVGRLDILSRDDRGRQVVEHVEEPMAIVRERVERACRDATLESKPGDIWNEWAFSCWLTDTAAGREVARRAVAVRRPVELPASPRPKRRRWRRRSRERTDRRFESN